MEKWKNENRNILEQREQKAPPVKQRVAQLHNPLFVESLFAAHYSPECDDESVDFLAGVVNSESGTY